MNIRPFTMHWMSVAIMGLALATALPSAWAQQAATSSSGDSSRGLVIQPHAPSGASTTVYGGLVTTPTNGTTSSSGALGGLVTTTNSQTSYSNDPPPMKDWSPAEKAAYITTLTTIEDNRDSTVNSNPELIASAVAMQLAVPAIANVSVATSSSVHASLTDADRTALNLSSNIADAQSNLAAADTTYLGAAAAAQLRSQGYTNAADYLAMQYGVHDAETAAAYIPKLKAELDQAQQAYNASWTTFEAQTGISHDQALEDSTKLDNSVLDRETTREAASHSTPASDTASTTPPSTNANSADSAAVGAQAAATAAQAIADAVQAAEASIQVIIASTDAGSDSTGTAAQQASQAEQAITAAGTTAASASATIANDSAAMTSDQIENTASNYDVTSGDVLSVANLIAIYQGYSINQMGSSVIQVTSSQVNHPTDVMTVPTTQVETPSPLINMPSSQVNVPSMQVNVPSLQIDIPSDQIDMPSDVMSSLDLQPALCGH